jgi:hypothetical protein
MGSRSCRRKSHSLVFDLAPLYCLRVPTRAPMADSGVPSTRTSPEVGSSKPSMIFINVVRFQTEDQIVCRPKWNFGAAETTFAVTTSPSGPLPIVEGDAARRNSTDGDECCPITGAGETRRGCIGDQEGLRQLQGDLERFAFDCVNLRAAAKVRH